jgi:hypothetical protein
MRCPLWGVSGPFYSFYAVAARYCQLLLVSGANPKCGMALANATEMPVPSGTELANANQMPVSRALFLWHGPC